MDAAEEPKNLANSRVRILLFSVEDPTLAMVMAILLGIECSETKVHGPPGWGLKVEITTLSSGKKKIAINIQKEANRTDLRLR